jgi:transcriptional regulator of acetoin/glycerol metabolism
MRAVEAATGDLVLTSDLFPERAGDAAMRSLAEVRDTAERAQIMAALDRTGGQVGEAARLLRVSRTTLWEKMQKLGI